MLKNIVKPAITTAAKTNFGDFPCLSCRTLSLSSLIFFFLISVRAMSAAPYKTLAVTQPSEYVTQVELNRPEKLNSFNHSLWT